MVNNLELIKPLLKFESDDDFYYLQILQRKKENPELGNNSRVIKNYYIRSIEYLDKHWDEIIKLCEVFNARASLRLNKRSFEKVAFKTMVNISNNMMNKDYFNIKSSYDRAIGQNHNDNNKTWILDFDYNFNTKREFEILEDQLANIQPIGYKVLAIIPSKSGFHCITKPFNIKHFKEELNYEIDIHKDNPTNLYIP